MSELGSLTEQATGLVAELLAVLEQEKLLLAQGDAPSLLPLGERKTRLIERINALEARRAQMLGCENAAGVSQAMTAWLGKHPEQASLAGNWKKLLDLAREAKRLHEINAGLLGMQLRRTDEILAALTRQTTDGNTLYDSGGQTASASGSKISDSA